MRILIEDRPTTVTPDLMSAYAKPVRRSLLAAPFKGRWRINVSPKHSSLAFDEVKEQNHDQQQEVSFEPELNLIINTRSMNMVSSSSQIVMIGGRVTVSF